MPNDKEWQRRTDEWVKMTHKSRIQKEAELQEKYDSTTNPTRKQAEKKNDKGKK